MKQSREKIIEKIITSLKPHTYVYAIWESGAMAFNRIDKYSDIDLSIQVAEDKVEDVIKLLEKKISALSPIEKKFRVPEPAWHGNTQLLYKLKDAPKYLILNVHILVRNAIMRFIEKDRHGKAKVYFDKLGSTAHTRLNRTRIKERMRKQYKYIEDAYPFFSILSEKALLRGNSIEAISYYNNHILKPLIDVLRMRYLPERFDFGSLYIHYDLPEDVVKKLSKLCYVSGTSDLSKKIEPARKWLAQEIAFLKKTVDVK